VRYLAARALALKGYPLPGAMKQTRKRLSSAMTAWKAGSGGEVRELVIFDVGYRSGEAGRVIWKADNLVRRQSLRIETQRPIRHCRQWQ
jgi:hypothetical protein